MPRSSAVVFSARSAIMSATTTTAPASPSARAQAAPIPCPPPVTTATRPSNFNFSRYISCPHSLRGDRLAFAIETVDVLRLRGEPDLIAHLQSEFSRCARRDAPDAIDSDIEEGIRAEVLGHLDRALPCALLAREIEMFRANADSRSAELLRGIAGDEIHLRRADEAGDEEIVGA